MGGVSTRPREQYVTRDRVSQAAPSHRDNRVAYSSFTTSGYSKPIVPSTESLNSKSFCVGDIIRLPHLVPCLNSKETNPDLRIYSAVAGFICPKNRFAIVVGVFMDRMHVLPMYTCHGTGVSKKPEDYKLTSVSVRHPQDIKPPNQDILARDTITTNNTAGHIWKLGSHVNVLDVVSVNYSWNLERGYGALTDSSRTRLQTRVMIAQQMMRVPVSKQRLFYEEKVMEANVREKQTLTVVHSQAPRQTAGRSTRPSPSIGGSYATMASFR